MPKDAYMRILKDIETHKFILCSTRGGSPAIIFTRVAGGSASMMGAYYVGEEWIPCKWEPDGKFPSINDALAHTGLDLILDTDEKAVA